MEIFGYTIRHERLHGEWVRSGLVIAPDMVRVREMLNKKYDFPNAFRDPESVKFYIWLCDTTHEIIWEDDPGEDDG